MHMQKKKNIFENFRFESKSYDLWMVILARKSWNYTLMVYNIILTSWWSIKVGRFWVARTTYNSPYFSNVSVIRWVAKVVIAQFTIYETNIHMQFV
jgi:hypothetical protein